MTSSWQVQAAEIVQEAYDYHTTDSERLKTISELFSELHPFWYWNVALNYRYIQHRNAYYLNISINDDNLYLFSTT